MYVQHDDAKGGSSLSMAVDISFVARELEFGDGWISRALQCSSI